MLGYVLDLSAQIGSNLSESCDGDNKCREIRLGPIKLHSFINKITCCCCWSNDCRYYHYQQVFASVKTAHHDRIPHRLRDISHSSPVVTHQ
jgi:hypothetical protein